MLNAAFDWTFPPAVNNQQIGVAGSFINLVLLICPNPGRGYASPQAAVSSRSSSFRARVSMAPISSLVGTLIVQV